MNSFLIVVDMQNDFIDDALGTPQAQKCVQNVVRKINEFQGHIIATLDSHDKNYLKSKEGLKLPVEHCIKGTKGWEINSEVKNALDKHNAKYLEKNTFGSILLPGLIKSIMNEDSSEDALIDDINPDIKILGLCTDICVVSNALLLKAYFPESDIAVYESCCAGVTPQSHNAAIETMRSCQIDIL